jgi:hypothetical protein
MAEVAGRFYMGATRPATAGGAIVFNFELIPHADRLIMRIAALDTMNVKREDAQRLRDWLEEWLTS